MNASVLIRMSGQYTILFELFVSLYNKWQCIDLNDRWLDAVALVMILWCTSVCSGVHVPGSGFLEVGATVCTEI